MTTADPAPGLRRVPLGVALGVGGAWAVAIALAVAGNADLLHHDALAGHRSAAGGHHQEVAAGRLPLGVALALALVGWQVMVAATMLPSTVPLLRLFARSSARQDRPRLALSAFVGGYVVVWAVFGALAVVGDLALHRSLQSVADIEARPWLVAGPVLVLAGLFQFTDLKDRCLRHCRHPALWMLRSYRRGVGSAFQLGRQHGLFCLGCCWALMLVMFVAGVASLLWMAALAALMAYEKIGRHGEGVRRAAGAVLVAWGLLTFADPTWQLPGFSDRS